MRKFFFLKLAWSLAILMLVGIALSLAPVGARAETVSIPRSVDVYAQPGGVGKPVGSLKRNSQVTLLKQRSDHWCQVSGGAVPGGTGWIWCGMGDDGKDYSVKASGGGGKTSEEQGGGGQVEHADGPKLFHCHADGVTGPGASQYAERDISADKLDDAISIYVGGLSAQQVLFSAVNCTPKS